MITVGNKTYELIHDHKNGWNQESFRARFSEVLERYDYIVGDWGYNQLRLKGFFRDNHPKASKDALIGTVQDYLNEYCNFGCAYFILQKVPSPAKDKERKPDEQEQADRHSSPKAPDGMETGKSRHAGQREQTGAESAHADPSKEETHPIHEGRDRADASRREANNSEAPKREFQRRDNHREDGAKGDSAKREYGRRESAKGGFRGKPKHHQGDAPKKPQTH